MEKIKDVLEEAIFKLRKEKVRKHIKDKFSEAESTYCLVFN